MSEHNREPESIVTSTDELRLGMQVHEKSILMPLLPLTLLAPLEPRLAALITPVASFSLFPLLERDGQAVPYFALTTLAAVLLPALAAAGAFDGTMSVANDAYGGQAVRASPFESSVLPHAAQPAGSAGSVTSASASTGSRPVTRLHGRQIAEQLRAGASLESSDVDSSPPQQSTQAVQAHASGVRRATSPRRRRGGAGSKGGIGALGQSEERQQAQAKAALDAHRRGDIAEPNVQGEEECEHTEHSQGTSNTNLQLSARAKWAWAALQALSTVGMMVIHVVRLRVPAPAHLPWLHDAILSAYAFVHFAGLLLYATWRQLQLRGCDHNFW